MASSEGAPALQTQIAELQQALEGHGFARESAFGRAIWRGNWNGRRCSVALAEVSRTRYQGEMRRRQPIGFTLRVDMQTPVRARLIPVRQGFADNLLVRWIYRLRKQVLLPEVPAVLCGYRVQVSDSDWALRLLDEAGVAERISELLNEDATPAFGGSAYLNPTSETGMWFYASPHLAAEQLTPTRVLQVMQRLDAIARVAEGIAPPLVPLPATRFGRISERYPWVIALGFFAIGLVALAVLALLMIALGYLVFG